VKCGRRGSAVEWPLVIEQRNRNRPALIIQSKTIQAYADWQSQLRDVITSPRELLAALNLHRDEVAYSAIAARDFPLKVPRSFVARMKPGDPADPLLRQVLASGEELLAPAGYSDDPVGEQGDAITQPGIIRKYRGRALLILSGGCAINCRYCFRRHFPYSENLNSRSQWRAALLRVAEDPSISEIILSGGEPLLLPDAQLRDLVSTIAAMAQIKRLRVHTRLPVVIPERVTEDLAAAICRPGLSTVLVIHSNHANEVDGNLAAAMIRLRERGVTVLNQSVLLAGVNDSAAELVELSEALFSAGVLPYYLHLLDRVRGAAHFDVPEDRARELMRDITAALPGYLVPRLVREEAGAPSKTGIAVTAST